MRLGGTETIKVDVRILAASNEDLKKLVAEGRFRDDLFHRLNVISLQLPPLRERKEDIPLLVTRFLEQFCRENGKPERRFTHEAMKLLMDYDWPGNVRELENAVERGVVLSTHETMDSDLLPESVRSTRDRQRRARATFRIPAASGEAKERKGSADTFAVCDSGGSRAANHCGHARAHKLEPDGSRRAISNPAFDAQPENQAAADRDAAAHKHAAAIQSDFGGESVEFSAGK